MYVNVYAIHARQCIQYRYYNAISGVLAVITNNGDESMRDVINFLKVRLVSEPLLSASILACHSARNRALQKDGHSIGPTRNTSDCVYSYIVGSCVSYKAAPTQSYPSGLTTAILAHRSLKSFRPDEADNMCACN